MPGGSDVIKDLSDRAHQYYTKRSQAKILWMTRPFSWLSDPSAEADIRATLRESLVSGSLRRTVFIATHKDEMDPEQRADLDDWSDRIIGRTYHHLSISLGVPLERAKLEAPDLTVCSLLLVLDDRLTLVCLIVLGEVDRQQGSLGVLNESPRSHLWPLGY
jgi:hypothetical protein